MPYNAHPTKSGPGRRHQDGQKHGRAPVTPKGAPDGFVQRRAPEAVRRRRALVAELGRRLARRALRLSRIVAKARAEAEL